MVSALESLVLTLLLFSTLKRRTAAPHSSTSSDTKSPSRTSGATPRPSFEGERADPKAHAKLQKVLSKKKDSAKSGRKEGKKLGGAKSGSKPSRASSDKERATPKRQKPRNVHTPSKKKKAGSSKKHK